MVTELFNSSGQNVSDPVLDRLRLATLGYYDIAGELGRGGMAIVYVARDLKLERTVAIKVMDPRLALAQGMADRFLLEARIAAQLQHPNIIVVHEIQHSEELIYFVMGLVEGGSLDELCQPGEPLPIDQARWILLQAARALSFAHAEGYTHRDVKPANILVNLKGDVILTDFGIAKAVSGGSSMTKSGTQIGTPAYMSPEQFGNVPAGPASDQYALGVTAYRLLTGETPFNGDLYQLIGAHINTQAVPLRDLRPDCPAFLANAVMRMLEKKPEQRWPSLDDLIAVFSANMAMDGGQARKQLSLAAQALHRARATSVSALTARAPLSPTPTNAAPRPAAPVADPVVVSISPPGATIFVRGSLQLRASVHLESGDPLQNARVIWSSGDPAVVTVNADGLLEGVAPGTAVVRATAQGEFEEATIRVEPAPIARVTVTNPKITLRAGDSVRPHVSAVDVNGMARSDVSFSWVSRVPSIAHLESPGSIRAVAPGDAVVEVSVGNMRRLIEVTVVRRPAASIRIQPIDRRMELGDARALQVRVIDDQGNDVPAPAVQWTSSEPSAIYVDSAGTALAIGPGVSTISATIDDASDSVELAAVEAPVGSLQLTLQQHSAEVGDELAVNLVVKDATGAPRSSAGVRVWSSAPEIAKLDVATMTVHAVAAGNVRVHAACDDATNTVAAVSAELRVSTPVVVRIEVTPATLDIEQGGVAGIAVHCVDARGREVRDVSVTFDSAVPDVAVVYPNGAVQGVAGGATELTVSVTNANGQTVQARVPVRVRKLAAAPMPPAGPPAAVPTAVPPNAGPPTIMPAVPKSRASKSAARDEAADRAAPAHAAAHAPSHATTPAAASQNASPVSPATASATGSAANTPKPAASSRTVMIAAGTVAAAVLAWVLWPSGGSETPATPDDAATPTATVPAPAAAPTVVSGAAVLVLDAKSLVITLGDSARVAARVDSAGARVAGAAGAVSWRSLDNARVSVSSAGVVRGNRVGIARVVATRGSLTDTVAVNVAPRERQLTSIRITGGDSELPVGTPQQLAVEFLDAQQLAMTRDVPAVRWSSSDSKIASVSNSGVVTLLSDKSATISASAGGRSAKISVRGKRAAAPAPVQVVATPQEEFEATVQAFDRAPADRGVARTTRQKLDSLESLVAPGEQARMALYQGRAFDVLDQKDDACRTLGRAGSLRGGSALVPQIEDARRKAGCIAPEAPKPEPAAAPGKKQSELKAELDSAVMRYTKAFESRDVARVRAAFPSIPKAKLDGYAGMFREARELTVTIGAISAGGEALSETVGATVDVTVPVRVVFRPRSGSPTDSRTEWKMRLQRTANGWMLIALD